MIGIVLVTHGRLAREFIAALEHVVGPQQCVATVCIGPDDDMEKRRAEILRASRACDEGDGVDPADRHVRRHAVQPRDLDHGRRRGSRCIAGINLPMLIKLASVRRPSRSPKAVRSAQEAGRKYINVASRILAKEAS